MSSRSIRCKNNHILVNKIHESAPAFYTFKWMLSYICLTTNSIRYKFVVKKKKKKQVPEASRYNHKNYKKRYGISTKFHEKKKKYTTVVLLIRKSYVRNGTNSTNVT